MSEDKKPVDKKAAEKKKIQALIDKRVTTDVDTIYLETGAIGLDLGLTDGKGIPLGDWITVVAEAGTGKTTVFADAIRRILTRVKKHNLPFKAVYIDIENSKKLLTSMGLGEFILDQSLIHIPGRMTFEELDVLYDTIIKGDNPRYKDVKVIVIDSITAVISGRNAEGNCEDSEFGNDAKALSKFLKKYVPLHEENKMTTIAICQVRQNQGASTYQDPKKAALVDAAKHYSTVIAKLRKSTSDKDTAMKKIKIKTIEGTVDTQEKFVVTMSTTGTDKKNRHGKIQDVSMLVEYGKRVINTYTLVKLMKQRDLIIGSAGWYTISKDLPLEVKDAKYTTKELNAFITQNRRAIVEYLKENNMYSAYIGKVEEVDDGYGEEQ